jgi:hypothetical protein
VGSDSEEMVIIHEYEIQDMPKRRLLELYKAGKKLYKICEYRDCEHFQEYQPIESDEELMTYCLHCTKKVVRYGVED